MSKMIQGVAAVGVAVGMGAAAFFNPALVASPLFDKIWAGVVMQAAGDFAGAIGDALTSNRGMAIGSRQVAAYRPIIKGPRRVGPVMIYRSTTGSHLDTLNYVYVIAGHTIAAITGLYLDGRKVYFEGSGTGWAVRNGVGFGGWADGDDHVAPDGSTYNFGGNVFAEARYGDQVEGDVMASLTANDPVWAADPETGRSPWVGGCAYFYLHVRSDPSTFPGEPEVRVEVLGDDKIWDPRDETFKYTNNWILVTASIISQPKPYGLGGVVNQAQLIAAANICEEQVLLASGETECRWLCSHAYDTGTAPGDALQALMPVAAGRITCVGGEWYIFPAVWTPPEFEYDERILIGPIREKPYLKKRDMCNRMGGMYTAPNWPYNPDFGNLYDQNGWYQGTREDTFALAWQPTSIPAYSRDIRHGFSANIDLDADGELLVQDMDLRACVSMTQAQRALKIAYMRKRLGGYTATYPMSMAAYEAIPNSCIGFTFGPMGDGRRVLDILDMRFSVQPPQSIGAAQESEVPAFVLELDVQGTAPEVYEWDVTEEQTIYNVAATSQVNSPYAVAPLTALTLASVTSTGSNTGLGGDSTNFAIQLAATMPSDARVASVQIQAKLHSVANWYDTGTASAPPIDPVTGAQSSLVTLIYGVNEGDTYDVRARAVRSNGAFSAWAEVDNFTVTS